jgi:hypothetical protein
MDMDCAERRQGMVFGEIGKQMQQDGGVQATGERAMPGPGIAPGCKVQQKPGRQITHGLTSI